MTCPYCRSINSQHDHRCRRCGRRLSGSPNDTTSDGMPIPYVNGALAAIAQPERREKALAAAVADTAPQGHLFERPLSKVVPFESISGARVQPLPVRSMVPPVAPISPR